MSKEENTVPIDVAPCACSNCNSAHRKCDRKLPVCGGCSRKKKTDCTYEYIPAKRLRRLMEKERLHHQPYPSPGVNEKEENGSADVHSNNKTNSRDSYSFRIPTLSQLDMQIEKNTDVIFAGNNSILPPINANTLFNQNNTPSPIDKITNTPTMSPTPIPTSTIKRISPDHSLPTISATPTTTTALEKYFEHLYLNSPLIDLSKAQSILAYRRKIVNENDSSLISSLMSSRDDVALIFAMQGMNFILSRLIIVNSLLLPKI
jgi:hypothetical protein